MSRTHWVITGLVAVAAVLGTLLAVNLLGGGPRYALAQVSEGSAGYIVGLLGPTIRESRLPLFLIDTKAQTILVYEYDQSRRLLYLRVARSFRNDRELLDNSWGQQNAYQGPSVNDVKNILRRRLRGQ